MTSACTWALFLVLNKVDIKISALVAGLLVVLERGIDKKKKSEKVSSTMKNKTGKGLFVRVEWSCNAKWSDQSSLG